MTFRVSVRGEFDVDVLLSARKHSIERLDKLDDLIFLVRLWRPFALHKYDGRHQRTGTRVVCVGLLLGRAHYCLAHECIANGNRE